jgi:hypothetical protein
MEEAFKRKQNKPKNNKTDNSFKKVFRNVKEDRDVSKATLPTPSNKDDEEVEVTPKKKFQNNSKKKSKL